VRRVGSGGSAGARMTAAQSSMPLRSVRDAAPARQRTSWRRRRVEDGCCTGGAAGRGRG
jgi:hypothetical protein